MLRTDSLNNDNLIAERIAKLEAGNFPMVSGLPPIAMFADGAQLMSAQDSLWFNNNTDRKESFRLLRKRKALRHVIRKKVNVVAFANLVVDHPEKLSALVDELERNSGRLLAQLILSGNAATRIETARNLIVNFLNKNIERIAGGTFGFAQVEEPALKISPPSPVQTFNPSKHLYINDQIAFEGKQAFIDSVTTMLNELDTPMYVFVNYSQDVSTGSYLQRAQAARPKGLPDGAKYVVITLVNIPGSVKYQLVVGANRKVNTKIENKSVKEDMMEVVHGLKLNFGKTLVDYKHTALFDFIYENNKLGELKFLTQIQKELDAGSTRATLDLNYTNKDTFSEWINSWKIRVVNSETVLNNTVKVIQDAKKGEKLGKIFLRANHIYVAKYRYNERDYPIAIYNSGGSEKMENVFTKIVVEKIGELRNEENRKYVFVDETYLSYFIVAFYEDNKTVPTLMIQVEKFPFTDLMHNSMEEWMKFLNILVENQVEQEVAETEKKSVNVSSFEQGVAKAVDDILTFKKQSDAACNLCVRAAILNLKKDPVLFPKSGSYLFFTYDKEKDPVIKGEISGEGDAKTIVADFNNLDSNGLSNSFKEEIKSETENIQQFWSRLQDLADQGQVVVGTYPGHVFMLVPGGMINVVNNLKHTNGKTIIEPYKSNPNLEEGDKYGFCFTDARGINKVPRILECGVNVKSSNAPIYANMDYNGSTTKVKWFRYIK